MDLNRIRLDFEDSVAVLTFKSPGSAERHRPGHGWWVSEKRWRSSNPARETSRCLLITGAGRGFCSGANLAGRGDGNNARRPGATLRNFYHPLLFGLRDLDMPIVTAVNGAAAGSG